jgi:superfamily II DNA or RNA helicase
MDKNKDTIYPDIKDKNTIDRFEFNIPIIREKDTCNSKDFKLAPYQIFLKNLISNNTPYNSILLYHGTGSGKTCSAVGIAENFRDIYQLPENRIIILSPDKIKQGWYNNIYDPKKLKDQCTSDTYYNLSLNLEDTKAKHDKLIKKYYEFFGYLEFANRIRDIYDDKCTIKYENGEIKLPISKLKTVNSKDSISVGVSVKWKDNKSEKRGIITNIVNISSKFKKKCHEKYSNRVLIIDEAHNIRGDDRETSDDSIKYIKLLVENTKNLKLILLTATPMYNKATEIIELLSLLHSNDNNDSSNIKDTFKDGVLIDTETFTRYARGCISYIKSGSGDNFPKKLYPIENTKIGELPIYKCDMDNIQSEIYDKIYNSLNIGEINEKDLSKNTMLLQCSNMIYPNTTSNIEKYYGEYGLKNICKYNLDKKLYECKKGSDEIFKYENIGKYSCKIKKLLENIRTSEGIVYIYSQYISGGIMPILLALEHYGYKNYEKDLFDIKSKNHFGNYMTITSENKISGNYKELLKICTSKENCNGEKIKLIIGNKVSSEGIDLKNIRSIHVIDPWYNLKRMEQIIGRGIRFCSHKDLPTDKNDTTIYLYGAINKTIENSIDFNFYKLAEKKNREIVKIEKILQENSIDSDLFNDINSPKKTTEKCKLTIKKNMNSLNKNTCRNMFNIYEIYIKKYYEKNISGNIEDIKKDICDNNIVIDINIDLLYLTLKYMIKYKRSITYNDKKGYLIYRNMEYIYQPLDNKDKDINIYERSNNMKKDKYINLTIKKSTNKVDKKINIIDVLNDIDIYKKKYIKKYKNIKYIQDYISVFDTFIFERLTFLEKKILIENMLDDKLEDDMKKKVYTHFQYLLIDSNYMLNTDDKKIGFILFQHDNRKRIKKIERDIPKFYFYDDSEYIENKPQKDRTIKNIVKKDIIYPNYYNYNYINAKDKCINKTNIYDNSTRKYSSIMCPTSDQKKNTLKDFKEQLPILYEKYSDILDNYIDGDKKNSKITNDEFCILVELIGRLHVDSMKIQYNYDEYMLQTYDF